MIIRWLIRLIRMLFNPTHVECFSFTPDQLREMRKELVQLRVKYVQLGAPGWVAEKIDEAIHNVHLMQTGEASYRITIERKR